MDPISTGATGFRMIWTGIRWIWHSRQAPWSAVPLSATMAPSVDPWHDVRIFGRNDKSFAIQLLKVRTIRPKGLRLRLSDTNASPGMRPESEGDALDLTWGMPEKEAAPHRPFERHLFVNLEGLKGDVVVDFEFTARILDNRRSTIPVWVRTNVVKRT